MKDCLRRLGIAVDDSREDACASPAAAAQFATGASSSTSDRAPSRRACMLAFAALRPDVTVIDGHISMQKRPNKDLVDALRALGATLESSERRPPADDRDRHARACAARCACPAPSPASTSPSLLIIAPLIEGGLTIEVDGELTSKPYVDLTLDEMAKFGVQVRQPGLPAPASSQPQTYRAGHHRRRR